jgi:hypothetical protein
VVKVFGALQQTQKHAAGMILNIFAYIAFDVARPSPIAMSQVWQLGFGYAQN